MLKNPNYTLRDFYAAISLFKPHVIFSEVRPENPSCADACIDGGIANSIVYAYAKESEIKIEPVDWFNESFVEKLMNLNIELKLKEADALKRFLVQYQTAIANASFFELQSEQTQTLVRNIYQLQETFGDNLSGYRNLMICRNIEKAIQKYNSQRILVIFGLDHKYFIDDHLKHSDINTAQLATFYHPEIFEKIVFPETIVSTSLMCVTAAELELRDRLSNSYYSDAVSVRFF